MSSTLSPQGFGEALLDCGVRHGVSVPDWVQLPLYKWWEAHPETSIVRCCAEDEAVGVASGLALTGARPAVMIQNQGFYACVNSTRALPLDAQIPMVFIVGQFGREVGNVGRDPAGSGRRMVRLLPRLLHALEIPFRELLTDDDLGSVSWAYDLAWETSSPVTLVVGQNMEWTEAA